MLIFQLQKNCHQSALAYIQSLRLVTSRTTGDILASALSMLIKHKEHPSRHVRETVMLSTSALMTNNWTALTSEEKKECKELFVAGFVDVQPEVQALAQGGFVMYLAPKSASEVAGIAAAFCRNSDKYAAIEKRKRKEGNLDKEEKPDPKFVSMVTMMSCIVLAFPYDLPEYLPLLLTCMVRLSTTQSLKSTISRTVQQFKRTHQDRWEDLKKTFSRDQLDALVGASQLSYMS
jgi:hypothetical protein